MMIAMPVLSPCAHLQRPKPPDILAGIAIGVLAEMGEAIDEALHVQRVDEADGADPEKSCPTEESSAEDGDDDHGHFSARPELVNAACEFGTIFHLVCRLGLIEPAQMCPPESTMRGAGDIVGTIRVDVMMAVIS